MSNGNDPMQKPWPGECLRLCRCREFLLCVVLLVIILRSEHLFSVLYGNLGWLQLAYQLGQTAASRKTRVRQALDYFERAIDVDERNRSAYQGKGLVQAIGNDEKGAWRNWQKGEADPVWLNRLGDLAKKDRQWNDALLYYRGVSKLVKENPASDFQSATVCQLSLAHQTGLTQSNSFYCSELFAENEGNLIINGQFEKGWGGWNKRYFSDKELVAYRVVEEGKPAPACLIEGMSEDYHGGPFQLVALPPGITVHYSAWIKVQNTHNANLRLLYIGWQTGDGRSEGVYSKEIKGDIDWTYLHLEFQVPRARMALFRFFPILVTGEADILVDDVCLKLLNDSNQPESGKATQQEVCICLAHEDTRHPSVVQ